MQSHISKTSIEGRVINITVNIYGIVEEMFIYIQRNNLQFMTELWETLVLTKRTNDCWSAMDLCHGN